MPETKFTTSFIPKKPIKTVGSGGRISRSGANLFSIISIFVFLIAVVMVAGVFVYKIKLQSDIEKQDASLATTAKTLDKTLINEAVRLSDRLTGVETLLDKHLSPSQLFFLLEEKTVETVSFSNLDFSFDNDGDLVLKGQGKAAGFESIIQQSDEYGKRSYFRDVIFSQLQTEEQGYVSFSFESTVDPDLILYSNALPDLNPKNTFKQDDSNDDNATTTLESDNVGPPVKMPNQTIGSSTDQVLINETQ